MNPLFTVGHHAYSAGVTEDSHGNTQVVYTPPKGSPGAPQAVYGWSTPSTTEPLLAGQDRTVVDVQLLVPAGFDPNPRDLIDLPSGPAGQFEVIGYDEDYTNGPFGWKPGGVLNLRRVDG